MPEVYLVGGAVRDELLGLRPRDKDYLVIGSNSDELKAKGFLPVGNSYEVFLHPQTREEYVLAPDLTSDLARRDLTINAMARSLDGKIIDPFHGQKDLEQKVLRHTSHHFADDPLRVYRVARFKSLFPSFTIAPETLLLMRDISSTQGFKDLPGERIFGELRRALWSERPSLFFEALREVGALETHFCELSRLVGVPQRDDYHPEGDCWVHTMLVLDHSHRDEVIRYSALVHDLGKGLTPKSLLPRHHGHEEAGISEVIKLSRRLLVPNDWLEASLVATRFHLRVHRLGEMRASSVVRMFYEMDAFRKPHLVSVLARVCEADEMGKLKGSGSQGRKLEEYFEVVRSISAHHVSPHYGGKELGQAIRAERVRRLKSWMGHP